MFRKISLIALLFVTVNSVSADPKDLLLKKMKESAEIVKKSLILSTAIPLLPTIAIVELSMGGDLKTTKYIVNLVKEEVIRSFKK